MGSVSQFLYQKLFLSLVNFWFSLSSFLPLFGLFRSRFKRKEYSIGKNSNCSEFSEKSEKDLIFTEEEEEEEEEDEEEEEKELKPITEAEAEAKKPEKQEVPTEFLESENDSFGEKETTQFFFKFKFPTYEEFMNRKGGEIDSVSSKQSPTEILGYSSLIEEPEVFSFPTKESNFDSNDVSSKSEIVSREIPENSSDDVFKEEVFIRNEEKLVCDKKVSDEIEFPSEKDSFTLGSDSDSISPSHLNTVVNRLIDSYADGFLSDRDFGEEMSDSDENHLENLSFGHEFDEESDDIVKILDNFHSEFLSEKDFEEKPEKSKKEEEFVEKEENSREPNSDCEESNGLESLWEQQELIEQLKMEIKKVRATGLPTILEESESPKIMDDLMPWKIDEKFQHEEKDPINELHKFYKSYRERMRKFDILNYQKMYAIGFLQLKDPLKSLPTQKRSSSPTIKSLLSQKIPLYKSKKSETEPIMKFIKELESELEVVYVGQMCLSWEFLQWQYEKALELWESDPRGVRKYNEVAGEFQQFQVLMERFIEDELFKGPRVPNYVKTRCVFRNLLQVPVIKEDRLKDRKKGRKRVTGECTITSDVLVEIIEESIRIFWRFVRADNSSANVIVKSRLRSPLELQEPADSTVLMEVKTSLQKKEKQLKDLSRSGKCILKRFGTCQEDDSDQVLCFFSQVDMKLVARVLKMSRITTDQLFWCRDKLDKISFLNRKIHVEPSFLLFPC